MILVHNWMYLIWIFDPITLRRMCLYKREIMFWTWKPFSPSVMFTYRLVVFFCVKDFKTFTRNILLFFLRVTFWHYFSVVALLCRSISCWLCRCDICLLWTIIISAIHSISDIFELFHFFICGIIVCSLYFIICCSSPQNIIVVCPDLMTWQVLTGNNCSS